MTIQIPDQKPEKKPVKTAFSDSTEEEVLHRRDNLPEGQ
jgi:hypothetical protein